MLDRAAGAYQATLDGNEQYENIDGVVELWRRIGEEPRLARLKSVDPVHRAADRARSRACRRRCSALSDEVPIEIDEFGRRHVDAFPRARALGYRGISSKSCKGFYRALLNRARVAQVECARSPAATSCRPRT